MITKTKETVRKTVEQGSVQIGRSPESAGSVTARYKAQATEPKKELSAEERKHLKEYEARIETAQNAFFEICDALAHIESEKLYPDRSLAAYCYRRWDMDTVTVTRYRNAIRILNALRDAGIDVLPKNEGQCRVLHKLMKASGKGAAKKWDASAMVKVWRKLVKAGGSISADAIEKAAGLKDQKPGKADGEDEEGEGVEAATSLRDVESVARKSGKPVFVSLTVRCSKDEISGLEVALHCEATDNENGSFTIDPEPADLSTIFEKAEAWFTDTSKVKTMRLDVCRN